MVILFHFTFTELWAALSVFLEHSKTQKGQGEYHFQLYFTMILSSDT